MSPGAPGGPLSMRTLHDTMAAHVTSGAVPGLVTALAHGEEVEIDAIGPMRTDTLFRISSMTKPMTATAVLLLVQDGAFGLDDAVDHLLPELADRRVLARPDGPLSDTVPAQRPITVRDLLTFTWGLGLDVGNAPIQQAARELDLGVGTPFPPSQTPDEWMRRLGSLPLMRQPGETWIYDTGSAVQGVLVARAAGTDLGSFLRTRLFDPLGMVDTGFCVPAEHIHRLPPFYDGDGTTVLDPPDGRWAHPPAFPAGNGGLVSTAADFLAFTRMLVRGGDGLLTPDSVALMTTDHITATQRGSMFLGDRGWGFGLSVYDDRVGWEGGAGTVWFSDLARGTTALLFTQRLLSGASMGMLEDFSTAARAALDG